MAASDALWMRQILMLSHITRTACNRQAGPSCTCVGRLLWQGLEASKACISRLPYASELEVSEQLTSDTSDGFTCPEDL